jgi:hypothetical protein
MIADRRPRPHDPGRPRLSVVVRSYNRLPALAELLEALLAQDHDSFEVVVIEQTTVRASDDMGRLDRLARDPRIRILAHPPLGGPGARNAGVRSSRGDLLVFIDDDDLPAGTDWLRRHEANFSDPRCLGVTGRFVDDGPPYVNMDKARRQVLSFNVLKWQRVYARTDQKKRVESLMGGNVAIPRQTLERFGLWDECTPIEDEPSLSYRINAGKQRDRMRPPDLKSVGRQSHSSKLARNGALILHPVRREASCGKRPVSACTHFARIVSAFEVTSSTPFHPKEHQMTRAAAAPRAMPNARGTPLSNGRTAPPPSASRRVQSSAGTPNTCATGD